MRAVEAGFSALGLSRSLCAVIGWKSLPITPKFSASLFSGAFWLTLPSCSGAWGGGFPNSAWLWPSEEPLDDGPEGA